MSVWAGDRSPPVCHSPQALTSSAGPRAQPGPRAAQRRGRQSRPLPWTPTPDLTRMEAGLRSSRCFAVFSLFLERHWARASFGGLGVVHAVAAG